jgi:hypothetical protein
MGILDDAIKEHLELKRQHGADDSELKQLENEAFGAAERPGAEGSAPDPLAEAPTEFMARPDMEGVPEAGPAAEAPRPAPSEAEDAPGRPALRSEIADLQEAPPVEPERSAPAAEEEPAEEESPAMEHEAVPEAPGEPVSPSGPTTEEREAIAEQPTEMYDLEEELASSQAPGPSDEDLLEGEMEEPRLAPVDPLAGLEEGDGAATDTDTNTGVGAGAEAEAEEYEEDDDFWDEKRLSDELDQALEAPSDVEEERSVFEEEEPEVGEEPEPEAAAAPEPEAEEQPPAHREEDVLEETPDFLEEAPEDDQLWFEQKPPKDFDFDD